MVSDPGTRDCLGVLSGEKSKCTFWSREGRVGLCHWSVLEPSSDGSTSERWRCHSPCSQTACETHSDLSGKGGGSAPGELHLLLAVLPREGFTLTIHTLVLIIKRGAEEQDDSVVRALRKQEE